MTKTQPTNESNTMTNNQIKNLRIGDYIDHHCNGRVTNLEVKAIHVTGRCDNERSGAHGHAYACLTLQYTGSDLVVDTSIHRDEYGNGEGYPTHDRSSAAPSVDPRDPAHPRRGTVAT